MTSFFLRILTLLVLACLPCARETFAGVSVDLAGKVPSSVTQSFVAGNFARIWSVVAPDMPVDTSGLFILFYTRRDGLLLGVRLPEWGGGGAIGRDTIIVPVDRAPLADMDINRTTVHELVHVALERAYGRLRLPRWFHEGLAMTLSGELSFEEQTVLSRAILTKRLLPLDSIEFVNRFDAYGAALAYSQSHVSVVMLVEKYGIDGIPELLAAVRSSKRFDTAMVRVFGFDEDEFERLARNYIVGRYRFVLFVSDTWLVWVPAALLAIAGYIAIRIRNRRKLRLMEEDDLRNESGDAWPDDDAPQNEKNGARDEGDDDDASDENRADEGAGRRNT